MRALIRFAKLVRMIVRKGKFRHHGRDFREIRAAALTGLEEFCPPSAMHRAPKITNPYLKALVGEIAFLKNSLTTKGGHLCVPALDLCYVRIPRSASTAASLAMLEAKYPRLKTWSLSPEKINFITDVNLEKDLRAVEAKTAFFTIVRNPFARIVSVYREFFERETGAFLYEDYLFGIFRQGMSFTEFVRAVELIPDWLKDQHLKPQHLFLRYYNQRGVTVHALRLEDTDAVDKYMRLYELDFKVTNASQARYDYRAYYNSRNVEVVARIYAADVTCFGYDEVYKNIQFLNGAVQS